MAEEDGRKKGRTLSSGLRGMRFMQRKRPEEVLEKEDTSVTLIRSAKEDGANGIEEGGKNWEKNGELVKPTADQATRGGVQVIVENNFGDAFQMVGRRSFNKFNAAFEGFSGSTKTAANTAEKTDRAATIPADQVVKWKRKHVSSMGTEKNESVNGPTKRTFKKPKL